MERPSGGSRESRLILERAQKAAVRFARSASETLWPHQHVVALEVEGAVVVLARGRYARRLADFVEGSLAEDPAMERFVIERPSQESIDRLAPRLKAAHG